MADPPRRSDGTRAAILAAARDRFAADGFERATIRAIAADADIDPSMVIRYFGSKDKLFAAAADFDLQLPDLDATPPQQVGAAMVGHFLHRWEGNGTLVALLRAAVTNDTAAERMRGIFGDQLAPVIARMAPEPEQAARRAGLVATQMLGFALCRYVLRLPAVTALSRDEIVSWLGPTLQHYLLGPG